MAARSDERKQFLTDVLTTAVENCGYGWFDVDEYEWDPDQGTQLGKAYAVVVAKDDNAKYRIDLEVIARGLGVIRGARLREFQGHGGKVVRVLINSKTAERLYMSEWMRANIMLSDRTNGEDGDMDVIDALAVVECGLFGKVTYS
jgi:hypothetical protein